MMRSDRGRALVAELPMDRLLTEKDRPFTQVDGRPTVPTDLRRAIDEIARARHLAADVVDRTVRANLQALLREVREPAGGEETEGETPREATVVGYG